MRLLLSAVVASLFALPAWADNNDHVAFYMGAFDISQGDDEAIQLGLEYRYEDIFYGLRPTVGANYTSDDAFYGYGGFYWDVAVLEDLYISPNFVAGYYSDGDGKDLHNDLQFRSGIEVSYDMQNDYRVGVAFNHISNASLGDHNPGSETLLFSVQVPLSY